MSNTPLKASASDVTHALENKKTFLLDFGASWCGPCKMLEPVLDQLSTELPEVEILKIDIDDTSNSALAASFGVRGIPTLIYFKQGVHKATKTGFMPKDALKQWISQNT